MPPFTPIPSKVKKLWDTWGLRLCITTSLLLQAFLLLLAPSRQRSRSNLLARSVWAAYLLADWIAAVAIGLITKSLGDPGDPEGNDDLYALWASFLLMHLGGPDGITSLSLEDNELWIRHLFGLFLQVISAAYSLYMTLSNNKLWFPNVLVFIGGNIKFAERTLALRLASLDHFGATTLPDPDPGPDYQEAELVYSTMRSVQVQNSITEMMISTMPGGVSNFGTAEPISFFEGSIQKFFDEMKLLEVAYSFFGTFKGLVVGFLLSSKDRESSRSYFLHETATRAFRLVEYELSFMYQVLHTKAVVIHGKLGYSLRFITICCTVSAFLLFLFIGKHGFGQFDIGITYALFIGAIVLDAISACKLIFSDWALMVVKDNRIIRHVPEAILKRKRWSESVSQKDIISHCLAPKMGFRDLVGCLHKYGELKLMKRILCNFSYWKTVDSYLKDFIFNELKKKSQKASNLKDAMEACSERGEAALLQNSYSYIKLKWSIGEFQYAESLLIWHLATELCYDQTSLSTSEGESFWQLFAQRCCRTCVCQGYRDDQSSGINQEEINYRNICKLISNYVFYLLVNKQVMLAPVLGNWNIVFSDTCAEAKRFFKKHKILSHAKACEKILSAKPKVRSTTMKGDRSKSVFFDACILAQQLQNEESQWEIMSRVWVEMLSYAAINCRPFIHAQQLSKGGELLTFTWLLMNHLGLGTLFAEQEQQAGTKMVTII
ncbi:uncharacterized protein LOC133829695 [Humulus lupulus]|uniref:uncharacterized protein LOC133829695 n=1 Tax=Humulus lupulus TaxID=3486 RepID=UPI002B40EA3E|nr:uncharacterized protein LOC133829695 [Humulus lupulus]XP_062115446.1 uncharacterized protein LOC133829695 [Humulus lupulus]